MIEAVSSAHLRCPCLAEEEKKEIVVSNETKDTDGLYYPHIHVRDEAWLKATLLYFPHILRMVPADFETSDSAFITSLTKTPGIRGESLLGSYELGNVVTGGAADRLTERLMNDIKTIPGFEQRFSRKATQEGYGKESQYLIHRSKAPRQFWAELTERGLMWEPSEIDIPARYYRVLRHLADNPAVNWAAVHPILGEAFMATVAAAAARDEGLEVVTDLPSVHAVASCRDDDVIYRTLILGNTKSSPRAGFGAETQHVSHLVITGGFDVSTITAQDLAKMSANREALFDFRRYLADRINEIPDMDSDVKRQKRLRAVAEEALDTWRRTVPTMSRFARRFFGLGLLDKSEKAMTDLAKALIPGSLTTAATTAGAASATSLLGVASLVASPVVVAAAPGIAVTLATYGVKTWHGLKQEEATSSLRYLSLVRRQGAALMVAAPPIAGES